MNILIVSDSHGRYTNLERAIKKVSPIDMLIHLGDYEGDASYIKEIADCPVEMVSGNNDYFTDIPREKFLEIGKYYVMLTHGHRYGVNYGTEQLKEAAVLNGADIVMFGHTHQPLIDLKDDSLAVINPGSITQPRQAGRIPTFILMEIDSKGEAHYTLNYIEDSL
ncbi:metallophosphoesterase family protein [Lachnoclostridium phytofermentans]|uniref:Phosphoesterase n=1 Tax=Lachnoclostridium phytofermentans (strain ATCC 700394 / DSM 18823 / ISDg) TaxID=357809 RepID=A9KSW3_LACP7|nr:metallophosphoesterase [Lachnoclostridium phytofermentans]ABX40757.1 phosphodiesterase, MJ0936 family [Lachnoclostridium phytofermentans ISDg]